MKVIGFDHVSIGVKDLNQAIDTFSRLLDLQAKDRRKVRQIGMENAFIPLSNGAIELIEPLEGDDSPDDVRRTLDKKGEGMMNLCLRVEGLEEMVEHIRSQGAKVIEGRDADGDRVVYIHPNFVHGVLVELRTGERKISET